MKETLEEAAEKEFPLVDAKWCRTGAAEEENLQLLSHRKSFIKGAKWMAEKLLEEKKFHRYDIGFYDGFKHAEKLLYSEEEVFALCRDFAIFVQQKRPSYKKQLEWFEQFKKK